MTAADLTGDERTRWLAFLYVADELGEAEREDFEARLAEDPDACAIVAGMVELLIACQRSRTEVADRRRARRTAGAAAGLALAAAVAIAALSGVNARPVPEVEPGGAIALEQAWSRLQRTLGEADEVTSVEAEPDESWPELLAERSGAGGEESGGTEPPGWLISAVALSASSDSSEPQPLEN
ncbi:hypothetical protein [Tautonia plasticadhaerens]|uniref:Zinc-finger domain-containing protein n=1 Tax=Tautonia plasticadhaerens TaxID=2527974 RepID=A0A518H941_9BACT|nr:hypothetical protein [Tautonia plasticadhaerens]QDV37359.1 hypothetical protein ElP_52970 [Tautonia plasticadhaerens]